MRFLITCLYFICLFSEISWASVGSEKKLHVRFEALKTRAGLTLGYIDAILQDSKGYIWLGGENGLARYDGYQFTLYRNQPEDKRSLSDNTIWALAEDSEGGIWIATEGGVNRYSHETDQFIRFQHVDGDSRSLINNNVHSLIVTKSGAIVAGTFGGGVSILRPEAQKLEGAQTDIDSQFELAEFEHLIHEPGNSNSLSGNTIWTLFEDDSGGLWIGTEGAGVTYYNPRTRIFLYYGMEQEADYRINSNTVRAITQDKFGVIWLGTDAGIVRLNSEGKVTSKVFDDVIIWDIYEDGQGYIWVATDGDGVYLVNPDGHVVSVFQHNPRDPFSISSNVVRQIMEDSAGDIWTANFPSGANVFHRAAEGVAHYRHDPSSDDGLSQSSVLSFLEGERGDLWVGTDGGGLNRILSSGEFSYFSRDMGEARLSSNAILSMSKDKEGNVWLGTWGGGVNSISPSGDVIHYQADKENKGSLSHSNVWAILEDRNGTLWFGTEGGGLNKYDSSNGSFEALPYGKLDDRHLPGSVVWSLFEDSKGYIWVGSNAGLSRLDVSTGTFVHFQHEQGNAKSLSNNTVLSVYEDMEGYLWVGTRAGLNRLDASTNDFTVVGMKDGLASEVITSILQDDLGMLWLGTNDGLTRLDPHLLSIRNYNQTNWAKGKFNYGSALKLESGEMVFGGINGFVKFFPDDIKNNQFIPPVVFSDFEIFNRSQFPGVEGSPLASSILTTDHIKLNHLQSVFSFEFCALNFYGSENNQYAYKLEGFDSDWNYVGDQRKATYTNLEAGEYQFRVKASNNENVWNETGALIRLCIQPAPWRTWWAYLIYVMIFSLLVWVFIRFQQAKIIKERELNQKLKNLDSIKDNFLANVSHELRTPLNGIIGLSESIIDGSSGDVSDLVKYNLAMVVNSGKRLSHLVNDILDFSLLKKEQIYVSPTAVNLRDVVDTVVVMSRHLLGGKEVDIANSIDYELPPILTDESRLQQILYNLLGNAIKYTDEGSIQISSEWEDDVIWIHVIDSGVGIEEGQLDNIFDLFQQVEVSERNKFSGIGLGLSVTKRLVELLGGSIKVESAVHQGSTFSFSLPYIEQNLPSKEAEKSELKRLFYTSDYDWAENFVSKDNENTKSSVTSVSELKSDFFRILIVDDEPVNRQLMASVLLMSGYQVVEASNGRDALSVVRDEGPFDLILLDVMMPRMSGYEVCSRLRKSHNADDMAIILLTAKNLIADLVDGFDVGANDFLTKPISTGELLARVKTHLKLLNIHRHFNSQIKQKSGQVEADNQILESLDGVVATINQQVDYDKLLDVLLRESERFFPSSERAIYWSFCEAENNFKSVASRGVSMWWLQGTVIAKDVFLARYCTDSERLDVDIYCLKPTAETSGEEAFSAIPQAKSVLALAIRFDDCIVGFLCLASLTDENAFGGCELSAVRRFHGHIKSALMKAKLMEALKHQNKIMNDASLTDSLTGLRNKLYLDSYLMSDVALSLRSYKSAASKGESPQNSDLIFFILNLDYFKLIVDRYDSAVSDRVLISIKEIMQSVFRESDFLIRWGGDEFLIVARFCDRESASIMAERLRVALSTYEFGLPDGGSFYITCSIGFACFPYQGDESLKHDWRQVISIAEMCLRAVKNTQRNSWLGLEVNTKNSEVFNCQDVLSRPQKLIDKEQLLLTTSIASSVNLRW